MGTGAKSVTKFRTVDLNGAQLHYAEAPGPGPALVILHGITGSHAAFLPLLPALAGQAHVYLPDLRGHNLSCHTPGAYQVQDYGADIAAFLQRVVGRPAIVAGHSLGGMVAAWVGAQAPEWVRGVFLEDPPVYITRPPRLYETWFYGFFMALREQLRQHHASDGKLDDLIPVVGQWPANAEQTLLEAAGPEVVRLKVTELHRMDPTVLDVALDGVFLGPHEPDALLAQIRAPLHLMAGQLELGGAMSAQDVECFAAAAPRATHEVVAGAGHMIHDERPGEYIEALRGVVMNPQNQSDHTT
jgi:pimeloyl-ACP methyl ester carboxylesterase